MEGMVRRRREQYRQRRDRETAEQRQTRLERQREYDRWRHAAMTTEQRHNLLRQRRERYQRARRCNEASHLLVDKMATTTMKSHYFTIRP